MKANGKTALNMDKDQIYLLMVMNIVASTIKENLLAMVSISGTMMPSMLVISKTV